MASCVTSRQDPWVWAEQCDLRGWRVPWCRWWGLVFVTWHGTEGATLGPGREGIGRLAGLLSQKLSIGVLEMRNLLWLKLREPEPLTAGSPCW